MRIAVNSGGLLILTAILILIHISIINSNIRDSEINQNLNEATDYAIDTMSDYYKDSLKNYTSDNDVGDKEHIKEMTGVFCNAIKETTGSKGKITVSVIYADLKSGTFDFVIQQDYDYGFLNKKGTCCCEKAISFAD